MNANLMIFSGDLYLCLFGNKDASTEITFLLVTLVSIVRHTNSSCRVFEFSARVGITSAGINFGQWIIS